MMKLEIKYKGEVIDDFSKSVYMAIEDNIKEALQAKIKPFEQEINQHGGSVEITVQPDFKKVSLRFDKLPQELVDRIQSSLA